jgi:hypothetical protein
MRLCPKQLNCKDSDILKRLAAELVAFSAQKINRERAELWRKLNRLKSVRPMVWINEIPWHEMNINDELTIQTSDPWAQEIEGRFRNTIYLWNHMQLDMIVDNYIECPIIINDSGLGIDEQVDIVKTDDQNAVVSRHFHRQIIDPDDIGKIKMPVVSVDMEATENNYQAMTNLFGSIMPVRKVGIRHIWFTPWDNLVRWWGVQEAMMDMVSRPDMVHAAVVRFTDACLYRLEQYERLNLLNLNNHNIRIGSGGYGYTDELPGSNFDPEHPKPCNMWGCSNAQIFSGISPEMHWEFAVKHDLRWLAKWGLTYYGCCEPLDIKMDLMKRIPNLRKISMSPWVNIERASNLLSDKYVFSYKPNPAIFAQGSWDPQSVRQELKDFLAKTRGCQIEIIMKDISTVQYQPQRLWEWAEIVMQEVLIN